MTVDWEDVLFIGLPVALFVAMMVAFAALVSNSDNNQKKFEKSCYDRGGMVLNGSVCVPQGTPVIEVK